MCGKIFINEVVSVLVLKSIFETSLKRQWSSTTPLTHNQHLWGPSFLVVVKKIHFRKAQVPKLNHLGKTYAKKTFFSKISDFQNFFSSNSRVMVTPKSDQVSDDCDQKWLNESIFKKKKLKKLNFGPKKFFSPERPQGRPGPNHYDTWYSHHI